jgi:hypothetical protein
MERHHNSAGNRLGVIARLELLIKVVQMFFSFWAAVGARLSTLMVGTQQVVGHNYNYMQLVISKLKAESILYGRFNDTLATNLLCEVETTIPN